MLTEYAKNAAVTMRIEKLDREYSSVEAFSHFIGQLWPERLGVDSWETLIIKYFNNPDMELCPGAGIYACFDRDQICGVQAAYPFPVVKDGVMYPGHMLVDWGALDKSRDNSPAFRAAVAGKLFMTLRDLPGRKFASYGSEASQRAYRGRAKRIPVFVAGAILSPIKAALLELLELRTLVTACPVPDQISIRSGRVEVLKGANLFEFRPTPPEGTVYVYHSPEFWKAFGLSSHSTGAVLLRLQKNAQSADILLRIQSIGKLRVAMLLTTSFENSDKDSIAVIGKLLKEALKELDICVLFATESDPGITILLRSMTPFIKRKETQWWSLDRPTDTFSADDVRWWLTYAERDSIWG